MKEAVDNLCIYDPEFESYAQRFADDLGGSSAICKVGTIAELQAVFENYVLVKFLDIVIHGKSAGVLELADHTVVMGSYLGKLAMNKPFLQRNARVLFSSCAIGAGESGGRFLDELGKTMLIGKGGIIGASTVDNAVVLPKSRSFAQAFLKPFTDGRLIVRKYNEAGEKVDGVSTDRRGNMARN
ncbi:MAG: hypothetical protein IPN69_24510 [Acidobacteria bacterium]|nr:hypothetical protein [Acidobacteriota bacterium]MBK8149374.1 hypothetical protein [Acidobacteriota bacterium]MBK8813873.1 hypothetical protein [Acidobacteriota bacterium]